MHPDTLLKLFEMSLASYIEKCLGDSMNVLFIRTNPVKPDSRVEKEVASLYRHGHKVSVEIPKGDSKIPENARM